jgi:uncharacterized LabA/DUF88 family protein
MNLQRMPHCVPRPHFRGGFLFKMARISLYIDGANFFGGLRTINKHYSDYKFDFDRFIRNIVGRGDLVSIYYYNASLKQQINPQIFAKQQSLFKRLRKIKKCKVVLCKRQRRQNQDGDHYYTIKGDDIHLAIDMLRDAYEDKYDTAVLISGDGDFAPLVKYVKQKGKKVENYHFKDNISSDLLKACDLNVTISKKMVNIFFYREKRTRKFENSSQADKNEGVVRKVG